MKRLGQHVTDEQWRVMVARVYDDRPVNFHWPMAPGGPVVFTRPMQWLGFAGPACVERITVAANGTSYREIVPFP